MTTRAYDFNQLVVIYGPAGRITGFAPGTSILVDKNEDAFSLQVGVDGEATRSKNNNRSGRITFTLTQSSPSNSLLSVIHNADIELGTGIFPIFIKDFNGDSVFEASQAWILKFPSSEYGNEVGSREWVIETDNLIEFVGSNSLPPAGSV